MYIGALYDNGGMEEVQDAIEGLRAKSWTVKQIAEAIGHTWQTVERWKLGTQGPANPTLVLQALKRLQGRSGPPARRRE